jgi:hypothetical protein
METLPLEQNLEPFFLRTLPTFPEGLKEGIVQYGPYVLMVLLLLSLFGILAALGITAAFAPTVVAGGWGVAAIISVATSVLTFVLEALAISPLLKRQKSGWNLLYYAGLVSFVGSVLSSLFTLPFGLGGIIGALIGAFLTFWILFQIREKYVN